MILTVKFKTVSSEKSILAESETTVGQALGQHLPDIANAGTHMPFVEGRQVDASTTIGSLSINGQPVTITLTKLVQGN